MVLLLAMVEPLIGYPYQSAGIHRIDRQRGDAPTDAGHRVDLGRRTIFFKVRFQAREQYLHFLSSCLGTDRCELIAAVTEAGIALAERGLQNNANLQQNAIAGRMPKAVVDRLEVIDVEQRERELAAITASAFD